MYSASAGSPARNTTSPALNRRLRTHGRICSIASGGRWRSRSHLASRQINSFVCSCFRASAYSRNCVGRRDGSPLAFQEHRRREIHDGAACEAAGDEQPRRAGVEPLVMKFHRALEGKLDGERAQQRSCREREDARENPLRQRRVEADRGADHRRRCRQQADQNDGEQLRQLVHAILLSAGPALAGRGAWRPRSLRPFRRDARLRPERSSARFNSSTLTRGSPRIPNVRPRVLASTSARTLSSGIPRALATRCTW